MSKTFLFSLAFYVTFTGAVSADGTLLFRATYDTYNTAADFAAGDGNRPGGIPADLQMRMVPGEPAMKNAVSLSNPEFISYPVSGNFRPDRGTVSFWVRPCNYTLADVKTFQMFFTLTAPGFEFYVYKFHKRPNQALFYLKSGEVVKFAAGKAAWRAGDWHKLDVTWDPNSMAVYIDGRIAQETVFDNPMKLPLALGSGQMALNRQHGFRPTVEGRETSYDRFEIYGRKLSAKEIFDNYRLVRPDAEADVSVAEEKPYARLTYRCFPDSKKLDVNLDLWAIDMKKRKDIPAELSLVRRKDGSVVVRKDVVFATPDSTVELPFGDCLAEGETYDIVAEVPEAEIVSKSRFHVPDMSFLKSRAGADSSVPAPWTPVKAEGEGVYSVLDRTYRFDRGVIPSRIVCRGEDMLVEAPNFRLDGAAVIWEKPKVVESRPDRVTLEAAGRVGDVDVHGRADLWFDGFCRLRICFRPGVKPAGISSLSLKWSVPRDAARYLLTPVYRPWRNDRYDGTFGETEYQEDQLLWTTGVEKGLCWWCESTANWTGTDARRNLHVIRGNESVDVTVDVISDPVELKGPAEYVMAFQATPVKSPDRLDRKYFYAAAGSSGNWTTSGWSMGSGNPAPDNMLNWTSFIPLDPKAFAGYVAMKRSEGKAVLSYSQPALISVKDGPWDYFNTVWCRTPLSTGAFRDFDKKPVSVYFCCADTGAADWHINNIRNLFREYPDLAGVYFDICDVKFCHNALHGHGGTDAFGKPFKTSTAMALRDYFLRVYRLCRSFGRRIHVHAHNKYYPFTHTFADACWPGEEQYYDYAMDPENHYVEGIGEEEYQAAWTPVVRGMNVYNIPQNSRASGFGEFKNRPELFTGRRAVMTSLLPSLLYDFKCLGGTFGKGNAFADSIFRELKVLGEAPVKFHGYWFDSHAEVAKGLRTALYTWKRPEGNVFLLVVGNTSREAKVTGLKLDWGKAGVKSSPLKDLVTGVVKTEAEWAAYVLASHDFLLLMPTGAGKTR